MPWQESCHLDFYEKTVFLCRFVRFKSKNKIMKAANYHFAEMIYRQAEKYDDRTELLHREPTMLANKAVTMIAPRYPPFPFEANQSNIQTPLPVPLLNNESLIHESVFPA